MGTLKLLCTSKNGKEVWYDSVHSHTATHFEDDPTLYDLALKVLQDQILNKPLEQLEIDMGKPIGKSDVVEVSKADEIVYAMRKHREDQGLIPFTKSQQSQPCSKISLYLEAEEDGYNLQSVWIGELVSPNFPQMPNPTPDSIPYWSRHAFVWGSQSIIPGTETRERPWD